MAGSGAAVRVAAKRCAVSRFAILPGEGAAATVDGRAVEVGGPALALRRGWRDGDPALARAVDRWEKAGATAVWVAWTGWSPGAPVRGRGARVFAARGGASARDGRAW